MGGFSFSGPVTMTLNRRLFCRMYCGNSLPNPIDLPLTASRPIIHTALQANRDELVDSQNAPPAFFIPSPEADCLVIWLVTYSRSSAGCRHVARWIRWAIVRSSRPVKCEDGETNEKGAALLLTAPVTSIVRFNLA